MVSVLILFVGAFAAIVWHHLGLVALRGTTEPDSALVARSVLLTAQFAAGFLLGKLYLLRCGQIGGRGPIVRAAETWLLPTAALVLSTRSHQFALWFGQPAAWAWYAVAVLACADFGGGVRRALQDHFRLDEREKPLYLSFPPKTLGDMLPWHLFVGAFLIWASWRIVVPRLPG